MASPAQPTKKREVCHSGSVRCRFAFMDELSFSQKFDVNQSAIKSLLTAAAIRCAANPSPPQRTSRL
jgi:hypothetical protein